MIDVLSKVSAIYGSFDGFPKKTPSKGVHDGPLTGNGDIGVVMGGKDETLQIYISKNDFWYAAPGTKGGGIKSFGYLKISIADDPMDVTFKAKQKILHAEIDGELLFKTSGLSDRALDFHTYVLRQKNIVVTEITAKVGDPRIRIDLVPTSDMSANFSHKVKDGTISVSKSYENSTSPWNTFGYAESKICGKDSNLFRLNEGETVRIITAMATNHDTEDYENAVKDMLSCDFDAALPSLWKEHTEWWDEFWKSSGVDIPALPYLERFWYASHYIMACCCGEGKVAPGIFGNWITSEFPLWAADYHLNYNYEAPWWATYSSNKLCLAEPYDQPLLDCIPAMKKNAAAFLNCRGLYSLVGIGPKGLEVTISYYRDGTRSIGTGFWGQKSNASYAAVNMAMRFYSTYDKDYALRCAYPYMREAAIFWEDYLRFEDGRYVIHNDCINENIYAGIGIYDWVTSDSPDTSNDFNPIISLGLIRLIMKTLIDICEYTGTEDDHIEKWKHILTHISEFPTQIRNGERVFRLTESGEDWNDCNSLIVQHIYPCGAIGLSSDSEMLEMARRTVRQADRWGEDFNAFPTYYPATVRVGYDTDTILTGLETQVREHAMDNFFIFYGGGGIECSSTVPNCINEMMFQSHEGILRFFPVWKRELDAEFECLRGYGAFIVSAKQKDGAVHPVTIYSEKGRNCAVLCPWEHGMTVTCDGEAISSEVKTENGQKIYTFATEEGKTYLLSEVSE